MCGNITAFAFYVISGKSSNDPTTVDSKVDKYIETELKKSYNIGIISNFTNKWNKFYPTLN